MDRILVSLDCGWRVSVICLRFFVFISTVDSVIASPIDSTTVSHSAIYVVLLSTISLVALFGVGCIYCVSCKESSNGGKPDTQTPTVIANGKRSSVVSVGMGNSNTTFSNRSNSLTPVDTPTTDGTIVQIAKSRRISRESYKRGNEDNKRPSTIPENNDYLP